jgi:hypothetical protein
MLFRFPDGSLQVCDEVATDANRLFVEPVQEFDLGYLEPNLSKLSTAVFALSRKSRIGGTFYNGLRGLSTEQFRIYYYGRWMENIEGNGFGICTAQDDPRFYREECPLENFVVTIVFKRTPTSQIANRFARCICSWSDTVSMQGLAGEGAVTLCPASIDFVGRVARLHFDARCTGQTTINWLIVTIASFCETAIIESIFFTQTPGPNQSFTSLYKLTDLAPMTFECVDTTNDSRR